MATQAQWNSEKYSSTCSRSISTDASVYLTPDSGSTWSSFWLGSTFSELHWKKTLKAWATRQCKVAGLDFIRKVSEGSLRKMGSANCVGSPDGRTSGSNFLVDAESPNGGISDVDLTLSCSCVISLRSSENKEKMVSVFHYHPLLLAGKRSNKQRSIISFSSSSSYSIDISSTQKGGARQHEWDRKNRLQNLNEFLNVWVVNGYAATLHKCMSKKSKALMFLALKYEGGENWNTGQNCGRSSAVHT